MNHSRTPDAGDPLELDAATMRRLGYRVVDLLVERIAGLEAEPVWRGTSRAELDARLREAPPESPRGFDDALRRLAADVLPFTARVDHPRFLAYVAGCPTWPGILGEFLAAGCNIFQGTWLASSGPSALELVVLDWFKEWIGYPAGAAGLLTSGGSAANLTALACAREARLGDRYEDAVLYVPAEAHSSLVRAARTLGFRRERIRVLPVDERCRVPLAALARAVEEDARAGLQPFLAVASGGTTSTGAVDPLPELAGFCADHGLWLHVDAAYGGFAALTERGRAALEGIERADSVTLDPHKWLYQPFEAGCLLVRQGTLLRDAFHIMPDFLQDTAVSAGEAGRSAADASAATEPWHAGGVNFADRGIQLTRAARAFKIWLSIQSFGLDAFRQVIDRTLDLTLHAQRRIEASPALELLTPATLGIVCFRRRAEPHADEAAIEALNAALVEGLRQSGTGLISSTRVAGRYALRLCILNHRTRVEDVERVLAWLETA